MDEINMKEIEIFLAVAKNQNISKTAQELYISQSALSSWISRMEEYCGVSLFRRTNRGVVLTPEGEQLYARLDIAYKRFKVSVREICGTYQNPAAGTLQIGCLNRLAIMDTIEEIQQQMQRSDPDWNPVIERFNFHELRNRLLCQELDLILTISSDIEPYAEFDSLPLGSFPLYYIVPKGTKDIQQLNGQTLIIEAPTNRVWAERICAGSGIVPGSVKYVNSYILMTSLVSAGEGFAIDGKMVTQNIYSPETKLIEVEAPSDVNIVLAWKKEWQSDAAREFISFCRKAMSGQLQSLIRESLPG